MRHSFLEVSIAVAVILVAIQPLVTSQDMGNLQPTFGQALVAVRRAESAGATPNEINGLIQLLNKALELNREALQLNSTSQSQERQTLLSQADQTLTIVDSEAAKLTVTAARRSYYNLVLAYVGGVVAAVLGTLACVVVANIYQEYRIRRTFQMKVTPK